MNSDFPTPLGVYVHWPYCARICPYCDFNVVRDRGRTAEQADLAEAIIADLTAQRALTGPRRLLSIFFGGGTPSLMDPAAVARVIETAKALWSPVEDLEISLEANPTDAEAGRFAALAAAGVARLSLGVQSLHDDALALLGRNHDAGAARRAMAIAAATFPRLSVDLIYARPDQSAPDWRAELEAVLAMGPEHVSPYQLTIEAGTAFDRAVGRGTLIVPDEDRAHDLFETTQAVLEAAGFDAYEVSNHARGEAARSRHNLVYWRGHDYVGVGPGAHGRLSLAAPQSASLSPMANDGCPPGQAHRAQIRDRRLSSALPAVPDLRPAFAGLVRDDSFLDMAPSVPPSGLRIATTAHRRIDDYIAAVRDTGVGFARETLNPVEAAEERLLLGLRIDEGVSFDEMAVLGLSADADKVRHHVALGLLADDPRRLRATRAGRLVLDRLTGALAT